MLHESQYRERDESGFDEPFERLAGRADCGFLLVCDHADNFIPEDYASLGLQPDQLQRHIAYDIGAGAVTRYLGELLDAPAVLSRFSRLLIDPNRGLDDPTLIMRLSDGAVIPGNADIGPAERERRIARFYTPYHQAVDGAIDDAIASGRAPVLLSVHSFTENWQGTARPWHATVLWDRDERFVKPLLEALRNDEDLTIGENVPYSGALEGDSMNRHGTARNLPHALIEIRQDVIATPKGQMAWAKRLAKIVRSIMSDVPVLYQPAGKEDAL